MFTLGAPAGPFIMGFVVKFAGLRWVYFTFAIVNFALFVAYALFGPETMYEKILSGPETDSRDTAMNFFKSIKFQKPQHKSFGIGEALRPFTIFGSVRVAVPICVYAIVYAYTGIAIVITMPQVMGAKFDLDAEGIGLQFIAVIIGLLIGEVLGGYGSDRWMKFMTNRRDKTRIIEDRLWLAYPGFACGVIGLVVWGVETQTAAPGKWTITPDVGAAIASVGCQLLTTVLVTYAIDVAPNRAAQTGLILNLVRQTWGFVS
jgi:hypothetical protein